MESLRLKWCRFQSFLCLREEFRSRPCIYLQTDSHKHILRVGESQDLWQRYVGGTAYTVEAAMHGSGNLFFAAPAPVDQAKRRRLEATLIYELKPRYNNQYKDFPPIRPVAYIHEGGVPRTLIASSPT